MQHQIVLIQLTDGSLRLATRDTVTSEFKWGDELSRLPLTRLFLQQDERGTFRRVLFEVAKETLRASLTNGNPPKETHLSQEDIQVVVPHLPDLLQNLEAGTSFTAV